MTPVVLIVVLAMVVAVGVVALAAVVTGVRVPGARDLASTMRAGLERPRDAFALDAIDADLDDVDGRVEDVFVVGRPADDDELPAVGLAQALDRAATAVRRR